MADLKLGPLMQINMPVKEIDSAVAFYRDTLGLPFLFQAGTLAFFDCGGVRLLVDIAEGEEFSHPGSILYFTVEDIHAAYEELKGRGVQFVSEPHVINKTPTSELWMAFFSDGQWNTHAIAAEVPVTT
ncbi:MAG: VOC family protein [Dehalococcoidia bacterium]|nr:VOC family protein [Dehalococcoidia bacterium]MCB9482754.1 VOC family protein [Dehalococcoidia bacterium]